jgi:hypothetical protein
MFNVSSDGVETGRPQRPSRAVLLGVAALIAGFTAPAARAQLNSGYSGSSSLSVIDDAESFRTLNAFGSCFASRKTAEALALIATPVGSPEEGAIFRQRISRASVVCLGGDTQLRMQRFLLRGAIAEGLYRRAIALPASLTLPTPAPGTPTRTLADAARCYTAGHRDRVRALIDQSRMGSREEYALLSEMAPEFFLCVAESSRGGQFISPLIRGHLAEALYRMPASTPDRAGQE